MQDILFTPKKEIQIEIKPGDPGYNYLKNDVRYKNKNSGQIIVTLKANQNYRLVNRKSMLLVWDKFSRAVAELSRKQADDLMEEQISKVILNSKTYIVTKDQKFNVPCGSGVQEKSFLQGLTYSFIDHDNDGDLIYSFEFQETFYPHFINNLIENGTLLLKN